MPFFTSSSSVAQSECINQIDLNYLFHDLILSKEPAELLASRLSEKHVFGCGTNVSFHQYKDNVYKWYSQEDGVLAICIDIKRLFSELNILS